ncbi:MAG TPA: hypothetical protein VEF53_00985 [Patescibacteria group bacterium]|nr:hypothetical protein [Patescibacteria group bacterium]
MHLKEAFENIGSAVMANDEFWGTYIGTLMEVRETRVGYFARVKIIKNIEEPIQHSIFYKDRQFERLPHAAGTIESFSIDNVGLLQPDAA